MTVKVSKPAVNLREELADLRKPTGIAGEAMLRAETPQEQFQLIGAGRRNIVINGDMKVAQRNTSATGKSTTGYYSVDRFSNQLGGAGTFTIAQALDAPDGFRYSYKVTTTTADSSPTTNLIRYMIEGTDMQHLAYGTSSAQPMMVSFWVKSNKTGTYSFNIEQKKTASTFDMFVHSYTIESEGVWEKKVVYIPPNTSNVIYNANTNSITLHWWLGSAAVYQNDSRIEDQWVNYAGGSLTRSSQVNIGAQTNNYFQITGVQLEVGKVATPFEHRSYGEELALCQRFFCIPVNNVDEDGGGNVHSAIGVGRGAAGGAVVVWSLLTPVPMRDRPEITSSGSYYLTDSTSRTAGTPTSVTINSFTVNGSNLLANYAFSSSVCDDDRVVMVGAHTAVKITLDAEL